MCKISIIMPVYNKEKYIRKAIDSIKSQTFLDWQLIIVDDGSTDSSLSICQEYVDDRILVFHVENGGVSRARNIGLSKAQGEYVTFVDADDYVSECYLDTLYNYRSDLLICGLTKVNSKGKVLESILPALKGEQTIQKVAEEFYKEQINTGIYGFVAGKLIKREVIKNNKIYFDEKIKLAEDYDFYLKVYQSVNKISFIQCSGYFYLQETENSAVIMKDDQIDFFVQAELQNKTRCFLKKMGCFGEQEEKIYLERLSGYVYTILIMNKHLPYKHFNELFVRLKKEIPDVTECVSGLQRWCMHQYKCNRKFGVYIFLKLKCVFEKKY